MKWSLLICCIAALGAALSPSCNSAGKQKDRVVIIQPLGDFSPAGSAAMLTQVRQIIPKTFLRSAIPLPSAAFYAPRARYRADSIIRMLRRNVHGDTIVVGLTHKDISTTKNGKTDWGIMGLAFTPGSACVVSSFRLNKQHAAGQFYKVAVHELGHTQGLPHCPERTCYMRDAEGGNPLDEEVDFCPSCKAYLKAIGWKLP